MSGPLASALLAPSLIRHCDNLFYETFCYLPCVTSLSLNAFVGRLKTYLDSREHRPTPLWRWRHLQDVVTYLLK